MIASPTAPPSGGWDLSDLFPSDSAWEAERTALEAMSADLGPPDGGIGSAAALNGTLERRYGAIRRSWRLLLFATLKADEDARIPANAARLSAATATKARIDASVAWFPVAVASLGTDKITALLDSLPDGQQYRRPLLRMARGAQHLLSSEGERLLSALGPLFGGSQQTRQLLFASDIEFPTIQLSMGQVRMDLSGYERVMTTGPGADREHGYDAYARTVRRYERTFGSLLSEKVAANVAIAKARGYPDALSASLDDVGTPREVYKTLLREVREALPLHQRHLAVKRRLLGVERLAIWDVPASARSIGRHWDVAASRRETIEALAPLGRDYVAQFAANTLKPWADTTPRPGKREGGYVADQGYDHPYVLLNHTGDFRSLTTYAHEWGHAMHSWYARRQPYPLFEFPTFVAEIPSKLNELLLLDHLVKTSRSQDERIFFLDKLCEQYRGTLFTQSMFADFEQAIHKATERGSPLAGPQMSDTYTALLKTYFGPDVVLHPDSGALWATVLHFYLNFYVFQYATCLVAATALFEAIRSEGEVARQRFLTLLSAGGSEDAYVLIRRAGIDLATPTPYRAALSRMAGYVGMLEAELGRATSARIDPDPSARPRSTDNAAR